jgi:hypothetical protein
MLTNKQLSDEKEWFMEHQRDFPLMPFDAFVLVHRVWQAAIVSNDVSLERGRCGVYFETS